MAAIPTSAIRNIGIIAHIDAGKTTLSERILFYCQKIHKLGEVHDGAATMDFMPEEQERGITISSACTSCNWNDKHINLVDTPGHVDFTMEVERCLRVMDGAVGVFCAVGGVEPQSETVWRQSTNFKLPKLAFINKMDRAGADFQAVLSAMRERLNANPVPINIPLGSGEDFSGVLDLIREKKLLFDPQDQGRTVLEQECSPEELALLAPWREQLLEKLAEADDTFLELWLEGNFSNSDIKAALARACAKSALTPVLCGAALRNIGVQPLLDAICELLPSPLESPPMPAELEDGATMQVQPSPKAEAVGLVFKVLMDGARKNCFVRLYSGQIAEGDSLINSTSGKKERIGRLYRLHADRREQLEKLEAGDIAAVTGFMDAHTGDTYSSLPKRPRLMPISFQEPVINLALEAKNADEAKLLDEALARYAEEDPTFHVEQDAESGLRIISGMGELHLEVILERLAREYKITPRVGPPQAVLRETVKGSASASCLFDRELGKERHQGELSLEIESAPRNAGTEVVLGSFLPENPAEAKKILPHLYVQAVIDGISDALQSGPLEGWPVADVKVTVTDIKRQEGISTIPGLRMAAVHALKEAFLKASPATLEPIMQLEISGPEKFLGPILSLVQQNGGLVENVEDHAGLKVIKASAPLRKLFGFSTKLRSSTQGRASFIMTFKNYDLAIS